MDDTTLPPDHYKDDNVENTLKKPASLPNKDKKQQPGELTSYEQASAVLIPLNAPKDVDRLMRPRGKSPQDTGWRIKNYSGFDAHNHMKHGKNVGVRLRSTDLVIDYDPRNTEAGDNPLKRFLEDFGIDLKDCFVVHTGGGGMHIYLKKPNIPKIVVYHEKYKGVEFKSEGTQVVAAGSVHPNGKLYTVDFNSLDLGDTLIAPPALLAFLERPTHSLTESGGGECTPEQLETMLTALDPLEYKNQEKWLKLMMACHHGTGGEGFEEFVEWSTSDPEFATYRDNILKRWDSLHTEGVGLITVRTLYKALHNKKRDDLIPRTTAEEDFADEPFDAPEDQAAKLCKAWVLVSDGPCAVRRHDLKLYERKQFSLMYSEPWEKSSLASAAWNGRLPIRKFESLAYLPGLDEFPDGEKGPRYNLWRPSKVEAKEGDVSWFTDHLAYMLPDLTEREIFTDVLSLLVKQPHTKMNFATLLYGAQGTGKSAVGKLMRAIVGGHNTSEPDSEMLKSKFTQWLEAKELAIVHEMMMDKRLDVMNSLKQIITEDKARIERKFMNAYIIDNCINLLCFTNHPDALRLEDGDRRWCVLYSSAEAKNPEYYDSLWAHIKSKEGQSAVKYFLQTREVKLDPMGKAPMTKAKENMRVLSMGEVEHFLTELFDAEERPFDFDMVRLDDVISRVAVALQNREISSRGTRLTVIKFLQNIGAIQPSHNKKADGNGLNFRLWIIRNHDKWLALGPTERAEAYRIRNKGRV